MLSNNHDKMESLSPRTECELPDKLASLDIVEMASPSTPERVLRKRKCVAAELAPSGNRRVQAAPRKRLASDMCNPEDIEALYLNKKVKTNSRALETIAEEPVGSGSAAAVTLVGGRKLKRHLTFQIGGHFTKEKIKKRRSKIKKLFGNRFLNRKRIPMKAFLQTIQCLELDDVIEAHVDSDSTRPPPVSS